MTNIDLNDIKFRYVESFVFHEAIFVSMIYKGDNFFDDFFSDLDESLQKSLITKMKSIGETKRSNWNSTIIETLGKKYPKQYCMRKLGRNNFRVSTTTISLDNDVVILILGFPKSSDESTKKIHQFYSKAQKYIDTIQGNINEIRSKLRQVIK